MRLFLLQGKTYDGLMSVKLALSVSGQSLEQELTALGIIKEAITSDVGIHWLPTEDKDGTIGSDTESPQDGECDTSM